MKLKILPQFYEELDYQYTIEDSQYFLGEAKLNNTPRIYNHINKLSEEEALIFSNYMEQAVIVYAWMGVVKDPLDSTQWIGTTEYSDGAYLWRDMHIYLVKNYNLDLPREFKQHVLSFRGDYSHLKKLRVEDLIEQYDIENYDYTNVQRLNY